MDTMLISGLQKGISCHFRKKWRNLGEVTGIRGSADSFPSGFNKIAARSLENPQLFPNPATCVPASESPNVLKSTPISAEQARKINESDVPSEVLCILVG